MLIIQKLSDAVSDAFAACGYNAAYGKVTPSNRPDLCQFQCNGAMSAAKEYRKAPAVVAGEVAEALASRTDVFASVSVVAPGFINLDVSEALLAAAMNDMRRDERLLLPQMTPRTIVVDYGGPNVAKPLHVGHLRSAIIGDSVCRIARFLGHQVIGDVHLGDWGLQMGMVIAELQRTRPDLPYFNPDFTGPYPEEAPVTVDELNVLYPAASARAKTDESFAAAAAQATVELQDRRPGYIALWKHVCAVSIADLKHNYDILGVHFDEWYGESDADPYIPLVLERLTEKGLLRESEGAKVVDVALPDDKEPMPPMLIVKSNGGDIYGTTDLGTIWQRMKDWKPDEIWYVVDNRQGLHFKQLFRCAALAGVLGETICQHIGFGTMNGKDGKPYKTREGGVMRLSDLIASVTASALERAAQSDMVADADEAARVAQTVGVAAMKIGDMVNYRTKDYVFDMERFLASDGKTGPYLQYAAVRINSILRKALEMGVAEGDILPSASDTERALMLSLTSVSDALMRAYHEKAPSVLCDVLFEIAGYFSRFYNENKVLTCPDEDRRASWLALLGLTHRMLGLLLSLLGISLPEQM